MILVSCIVSYFLISIGFLINDFKRLPVDKPAYALHPTLKGIVCVFFIRPFFPMFEAFLFKKFDEMFGVIYAFFITSTIIYFFIYFYTNLFDNTILSIVVAIFTYYITLPITSILTLPISFLFGIIISTFKK